MNFFYKYKSPFKAVFARKKSTYSLKFKMQYVYPLSTMYAKRMYFIKTTYIYLEKAIRKTLREYYFKKIIIFNNML
ncbi:hypothetical protein CEQ21_23795 [Niallia circulans]|uniref:Uncharacterized protein n=1 Tax=Niallia circulans TaxID=1397 RepID=A0A553SN69_NIACI|nr:hypothetical protein CEQ21_23795 [Niallia circulans]